MEETSVALALAAEFLEALPYRARLGPHVGYIVTGQSGRPSVAARGVEVHANKHIAATLDLVGKMEEKNSEKKA
jgi:hypothetical protein